MTREELPEDVVRTLRLHGARVVRGTLAGAVPFGLLGVGLAVASLFRPPGEGDFGVAASFFLGAHPGLFLAALAGVVHLLYARRLARGRLVRLKPPGPVHMNGLLRAVLGLPTRPLVGWLYPIYAVRVERAEEGKSGDAMPSLYADEVPWTDAEGACWMLADPAFRPSASLLCRPRTPEDPPADGPL